MGIFRFNFRSEVLSLHTDVTITFPSEYLTFDGNVAPHGENLILHHKKWCFRPGMKFQTVYLLHGGGEDDTCMTRFSNLERYAGENQVMTVAAQVKDSFYMDTQYGYRYFTYMTEELPQVVRSLFASSPAREDNFVVGMAMGGNGALALGLRRPDLYAACVDLSGGIGCSVDTAAFMEQLKTLRFKRLQSTFGTPESIPGSEYDLGYFARYQRELGVEMPQFYIAVGADDFIRDTVRRDRDALISLGYQPYYEEAPGYGHDWDFWELYLRKVFHEWLPLKRAPIYP